MRKRRRVHTSVTDPDFSACSSKRSENAGRDHTVKSRRYKSWEQEVKERHCTRKVWRAFKRNQLKGIVIPYRPILERMEAMVVGAN